jgi:hypothetical protein
MRKLVAMAAAGAMLCGVAVSSTESEAAGRRTAPYPVDNGGCYRWGESGYRWYNFCIGPAWLYPHQRVCRHGYCWYR